MLKYLVPMLLACLALTGGPAMAQGQVRSRALPSKSQRAWIVKDRLYVEIGVLNAIDPDPNAVAGEAHSYPYGEHFSNRLGDVIPFRVRIFAVHPAGEQSRPIALDFAPLKAGRLTFDRDPENDPDWVMADPTVLAAGEKPLHFPEAPQVVTIRTPDGIERAADLYDIRVFVQTKRRPDPMLFWLEFAYATDVTPNGSLDWKVASTPDFIVSQSRTSDNGNDLCMGNTSTIGHNRPSALAIALCSLGVLLVVVPIGRGVYRVVRPLLTRTVQRDPAEVAWEQIDPVLERTRCEGGFAPNQSDVAVIVRAVKEFYGIKYGVTELKSRQYAVDDGTELYHLLVALERGVLEEGVTLTPSDYAAQVERIERLVPRP